MTVTFIACLSNEVGNKLTRVKWGFLSHIGGCSLFVCGSVSLSDLDPGRLSCCVWLWNFAMFLVNRLAWILLWQLLLWLYWSHLGFIHFPLSLREYWFSSFVLVLFVQSCRMYVICVFYDVMCRTMKGRNLRLFGSMPRRNVTWKQTSKCDAWQDPVILASSTMRPKHNAWCCNTMDMLVATFSSF